MSGNRGAADVATQVALPGEPAGTVSVRPRYPEVKVAVATERTSPTSGVLRRPPIRPVDLLVGAGIIGLLAVVDSGDLEITQEGRVFVAADILESKQIFAASAGARAPLVRAICKSLEATKDGTLGEGFFLDLLRRGFSEDEARQQMQVAIDWGRYGELFDFDANTGQLKLEREAAEVP
jgi:hypothetical protein